MNRLSDKPRQAIGNKIENIKENIKEKKENISRQQAENEMARKSYDDAVENLKQIMAERGLADNKDKD